MLLGMSLSTFTTVHVVISLLGISSGLVVVFALLREQWLPRWNGFFLVTTVATSVTGFMFPFHKFLPSHGVGSLSLLVLAITIPAIYTFHLAGHWRKTYIVGAIVALYFNVFVLVVQGFLKVPALHSLAPNGSEPPFLIAQTIVLVAFIVLGILVFKKTRKTQVFSMAAD